MHPGVEEQWKRSGVMSLVTLHCLESLCASLGLGADGGQLNGFDFPLASLREGRFHRGLTAQMLLLTYRTVRQRVTPPCCLSCALRAK